MRNALCISVLARKQPWPAVLINLMASSMFAKETEQYSCGIMRNAIIHRQTFRVRQVMDYNEIHQGLSWEQPREGKHEI